MRPHVPCLGGLETACEVFSGLLNGLPLLLVGPSFSLLGESFCHRDFPTSTQRNGEETRGQGALRPLRHILRSRVGSRAGSPARQGPGRRARAPGSEGALRVPPGARRGPRPTEAPQTLGPH